MDREPVLLLTQPQQLAQAQRWNAVIAHHRYCIGPGFRLLRAGPPSPPRSGLMVICDLGYDGSPFHPAFCQQVLYECKACGLSGVILDLESNLPPLRQCVAQLDAALSRSQYTLYITESYAPAAPGGKVLISSAISGGALSQRLKQAFHHFGPQRVALALERSMEDFPLPAPTGCGQPLSQTQLDALLRKTGSPVFFSRELCARYFTYLDHNRQPHFVLFDDTETLLQKTQLARRHSIHTILLPWTEIRTCPQRFGLELLPIYAGANNI